MIIFEIVSSLTVVFNRRLYNFQSRILQPNRSLLILIREMCISLCMNLFCLISHKSLWRKRAFTILLFLLRMNELIN